MKKIILSLTVILLAQNIFASEDNAERYELAPYLKNREDAIADFTQYSREFLVNQNISTDDFETKIMELRSIVGCDKIKSITSVILADINNERIFQGLGCTKGETLNSFLKLSLWASYSDETLATLKKIGFDWKNS